jgi:hypothetical protein
LAKYEANRAVILILSATSVFNYGSEILFYYAKIHVDRDSSPEILKATTMKHSDGEQIS